MKAVAVECIGIGLAYGTNQVLRDITLKIEPGEFFALLGTVGIRQVDAAAADRRLQPAQPRPPARRRP